MTIRRTIIDTTAEDQIVTAMITSTKFLTEIRSLYNPDYFQNSFARIIGYWCVDYFDQYKKTPGLHIKDIYQIEVEQGMSGEDKEIIGVFLDKLSKQYVEGQEINADYVRDNAFAYFRQRELEIRTAQIQKLLNVGKVEEAEVIFTKYKKIAYQMSGWFNPLAAKGLIDVFVENEQDYFRLPGALGEIVGPIERDWFVAVLGPFKRGKSWFLQEMAVRASFQRLKVAFFSLEMKKKNLIERTAKRLTGFGSKVGEDIFLYPTFDCRFNQDGTCENRNRTNTITLEQGGIVPGFDIDMDYRPCTYCRDNMIDGYEMRTWYELIEIPQFAFSTTKKKLKAIEDMYGDNLRYMAYPRFTAGVSDIRRDLAVLEQHEGFIPDVIIVDYADILKPDTAGDKRNQIDDIWKMLASLAAERHCIVFTASQGTRGSIYKDNVSQDDLAEWIGKLGHVDLFLGLNQSKQNKKSKVLRVNAMVHRHKEVDENVHAMLLQQLEVGQFFLDSELTRGGD